MAATLARKAALIGEKAGRSERRFATVQMSDDRVGFERGIRNGVAWRSETWESTDVPSAFPRQMKDVLQVLAVGRSDTIDGAEVTIDRAWRAQGYQYGVGLDEKGRRIAFSISLSTGKGSATQI